MAHGDGSTATKTCFVISPIGENGSEVRRRADQILKHVIAPAARECGFVPIRADQINEAGIITSQVIQHIVEDDMVVADLTGRNPNVFYELAIRHAIRRPVVQLIQHDETIPFDVAAQRTIKVDHHDLDSVASCRDQLVNQMKAALLDPTAVDSPVTVAVNLQNLKTSDNPLAASAAELLSGMNELKSMVTGTLDALTFQLRDTREQERYREGELDYVLRHVFSLTSDLVQKRSEDPAHQKDLEKLRASLEHLEHLATIRPRHRLRRTATPASVTIKGPEVVKVNAND